MTWLTPLAFTGLILLAGPVIVHLLARRNARRVVFPATHLVRAAEAAAVRPRRPSDVALLLVRLAIVAVAVLAAAHPLVMTPWRLARWNARVSRAVIVDTSRSVLDRDTASRLADQEVRTAFEARRVNTPDLADGVERATRWLRDAAPSRREVVIVSDFQRGSLDEEVVRAIPADIGVRFIRAGAQPAAGGAVSPPVEGWRGGIWQSTATIDAAGTRVSWTRRGAAATPRWISVAAAAADAPAAERALRAATAPGVAAGDDGRRVMVRFAGADPLVPPAQHVTSAWIAAAALADVLRDVDPAVAVTERDGVMVVDAPISASALGAPAIVRAAVLAVRPASIADTEAEVVTLPDTDLARWRRDSSPVAPSSLPMSNESDGSGVALGRRGLGVDGWAESDSRWLWAFALVLVVVEGRLRRARARPMEHEAHANAA